MTMSLDLDDAGARPAPDEGAREEIRRWLRRG
jgi:hypothetical protein